MGIKLPSLRQERDHGGFQSRLRRLDGPGPIVTIAGAVSAQPGYWNEAAWAAARAAAAVGVGAVVKVVKVVVGASGIAKAAAPAYKPEFGSTGAADRTRLDSYRSTRPCSIVGPRATIELAEGFKGCSYVRLR